MKRLFKYKKFIKNIYENKIELDDIQFDKETIRELSYPLQDAGWEFKIDDIKYSFDINPDFILIDPNSESDFVLYPNEEYYRIFCINISQDMNSGGNIVLQELKQFVKAVSYILNSSNVTLYDTFSEEYFLLDDLIESKEEGILLLGNQGSVSNINIYFTSPKKITFSTDEILEYLDISFDYTHDGRVYQEYYFDDLLEWYPYLTSEDPYYDESDFENSGIENMSYDDYVKKVVSDIKKELNENGLNLTESKGVYQVYRIEINNTIFQWLDSGVHELLNKDFNNDGSHYNNDFNDISMNYIIQEYLTKELHSR